MVVPGQPKHPWTFNLRLGLAVARSQFGLELPKTLAPHENVRFLLVCLDLNNSVLPSRSFRGPRLHNVRIPWNPFHTNVW